MRELESIAKQVEVTALSIRERIARIHDALYALRDLTLSLHESTPLTPQVLVHAIRHTLARSNDRRSMQ